MLYLSLKKLRVIAKIRALKTTKGSVKVNY